MVAHANPQVEFVEHEIYRLIVIEQQPLLRVAELMQLQVAEVRQIVKRVTDVLIAAAPVEDKEQRQQRIHLSEQIAAARLAELYGETLRAYRQSQGEQKVVRQVGDSAPVMMRRVSHGDARLLQAAARIAMMAGKLPAGNVCEGDATLRSGCEVREAGCESANTENHPVGACSTSRGEQGVTAAPFPITGDVKSTDELISDILSRAAANPNKLNSRPVQASGSPKPRPR